mmetsp:Transcript_5248/g.14791  ORF Transcript_5248/g.14791 Transcript_5248/m.14791 type:complete len:226 (+) Transcript_5248:258-935(+)
MEDSPVSSALRAGLRRVRLGDNLIARREELFFGSTLLRTERSWFESALKLRSRVVHSSTSASFLLRATLRRQTISSSVLFRNDGLSSGPGFSVHLGESVFLRRDVISPLGRTVLEDDCHFAVTPGIGERIFSRSTAERGRCRTGLARRKFGDAWSEREGPRTTRHWEEVDRSIGLCPAENVFGEASCDVSARGYRSGESTLRPRLDFLQRSSMDGNRYPQRGGVL